ncbi:MAG: tryptophan-rich sensory protein [Lachnospiraceae bacterium]|nr:tryptophan-rich sensory protein [Lachnospiraceae bacterium]
MKNKISSPLIIAILIPLAVGSISALFSGNMSIYSTLSKPAFSPPALVFPIVWTILYILMGISSYLIYKTDNPQKYKALRIYILQLVFNFFWSIIFFGFSQYRLAFLWLLLLIIMIFVMIYRFYQISPLAAYLQIPYLIWCLFAAYLNLMIVLMN